MLANEFDEPGTRTFQFVIAQTYLNKLSDYGLGIEDIDPDWEFPTEYRVDDVVGSANAGLCTGRAVLVQWNYYSTQYVRAYVCAQELTPVPSRPEASNIMAEPPSP